MKTPAARGAAWVWARLACPVLHLGLAAVARAGVPQQQATLVSYRDGVWLSEASSSSLWF